MAKKARTKRIEQKKTRKFSYSGPSCGGSAYALLNGGDCFRVVSRKTWYIYNDTIDREMHVVFTFVPTCKAKKPRKGRATTKKVGKSVQMTMVVYPLETVKLAKVKQKKDEVGFRSSCTSMMLTRGFIDRVNSIARANCSRQMQKVATLSSHTHNDEELLYKCRKSKIPFVDMSFKPSQASLKRPQDKKDINQLANITWKRPEDYIPEDVQGKVKLYAKGIHPDDIEQGQLGDCWLMCSIAVVAESKTMIEDIFRHPVSKSKMKKEQAAGGYRVWLNKGGKWMNVMVDNYFPTFNCAILFGRSTEGPFELWVSLLEKAYAKVHGSYASIIGGSALDALKDLTGFPVYSFEDVWNAAASNEEKADLFFRELLVWHRKGYLISLSTPGQDTSKYNVGAKANDASFEEKYRRAGLGTGHAYSVMQVRQFYAPNLKMLQIRNPWGTGTEWTGDWGKKSERWKRHPLVKRSCKPNPESDGTFWMEWKDVVQYFDGGGVCLVRKKWFDYRFPGKFVDIYPNFSLMIEVKKKQKVFFTISQKDRRMLDKDDPELLYKGFLIAVTAHNAESNQQEVVALSTSNPFSHPPDTFNFTVKRDVSMEVELDPLRSPYYIIPRIMAANRNGPKEFTLGMQTPRKSDMKGFRVSFVEMPKTCPIFKNGKQFPPEENLQQVHMEFQFKCRGKAPVLKKGITAFGAEKVKEVYPFPY
ncbi:calpain-like cysteine peptidase [Angomonas deanei]|uniref:Calpain catalytic domain-containing protein n=1 Tax=Angomonas deanei TaxID=59799 RepID=A0A7G2C2K0_9TRYP|nr:calpain-like cysteine peptidase [Angomonas deanei]CAD2214018.1 Domain of unknown function (DUF1935)/Calpain family cysteine protease/Calpain large subunit, domain III, putative [Angomonas deanei]|eukprot:EPY32139.1 calpain-like cysteine peptidase [Angomonas deanei]